MKCASPTPAPAWTGWAAHAGWSPRPGAKAGTHGGLVYGFAGSGADGYAVCDAHKYYWVQSESFAAAARLALRLPDRAAREQAWQRYDALWQYAWAHFVDHQHGAWWRVLSPDNHKLSDEKSPAGKTDYHTIGACLDVLEALRALGERQRADPGGRGSAVDERE